MEYRVRASLPNDILLVSTDDRNHVQFIDSSTRIETFEQMFECIRVVFMRCDHERSVHLFLLFVLLKLLFDHDPLLFFMMLYNAFRSEALPLYTLVGLLLFDAFMATPVGFGRFPWRRSKIRPCAVFLRGGFFVES
jgi:hypothetical protein